MLVVATDTAMVVYKALSSTPDPIDPAVHKQDATGKWWRLSYSPKLVDDALGQQIAGESAARAAEVAAEAAERAAADTALDGQIRAGTARGPGLVLDIEGGQLSLAGLPIKSESFTTKGAAPRLALTEATGLVPAETVAFGRSWSARLGAHALWPVSPGTAWNNGVGALTPAKMTMAPSAAAPLAIGDTPHDLTTTTGEDKASRHLTLTDVDFIAGQWVQMDTVVTMADAKAVGMRCLPNGFTNPEGNSTDRAIVMVDPASGDFVSGPGGFASIHIQPQVTPLGGDSYHIRFAFRAIGSGTGGFALQFDRTLRNDYRGNFLLGQTPATVHHLSVQVTPTPYGPPVGMVAPGTDVESVDAQLDLSGLKLDGDFVLSALLDVAPGFAAADIGNRNLLKLGGQSFNLGTGLQVSGRTPQVIVNDQKITVPNLYSGPIDLVIHYLGGTLSIVLGGRLVHQSARSIRLAGDMGTLRIYPGVGLSRLRLERTPAHIAAYQRGSDAPAGGQAVEVFGSGSGTHMTVNAAGEIGGRFTREVLRDILWAERFRTGIPESAMAITPRTDGAVDFLDATWSEIHRAFRKLPGGLPTITQPGARPLSLILARGQSLAFGYPYGNPVYWPATPFFVDIDGNGANSVFSNSSYGGISSGLISPQISPARMGVAYPFTHRYVREMAQIDPKFPSVISRTVAQSGASIEELWASFMADPSTSIQWQHVLNTFESARAAADRFGFTLDMPVFIWMQGHANRSDLPSAYLAKLAQARNVDLRGLLDTYMDDPADPLWVMVQSGGATESSALDMHYQVALAQIRYGTETPNTVLATSLANHRITLADDNVHPDAVSTTWFSEMCAEAARAVQQGERWNIGKPEVTLSGTQLVVDYDGWLRPDERLIIAPDPYGGIGINQGMGFEIVSILDSTTEHLPARYSLPPGTAPAQVTNVAVAPSGRAYILTLDQLPTGPFALFHAWQRANLKGTASPNWCAHRTRLRTDWRKPSMILPDVDLERWLPSDIIDSTEFFT
ncbi:hypothetical protein [Palleronia caenipelagi]|uniref:Sialate O-acetylesterase domain-containing protein n=1 Tax=Palleronia caenipelagi TaxID=2489174 RepID=A0A547PW99_9RHOB|nr:hypothetical protein [Palleronia caenipelagi]TRD18354.1 hypothetical protein FEV53_11910 [Palleronia caenipelagi]